MKLQIAQHLQQPYQLTSKAVSRVFGLLQMERRHSQFREMGGREDMRRFVSALVVFSSLIQVAPCLGGTRPRYGGTLRVNMQAALVSLDPADANSADPVALDEISHLLFDTLVTLDGRGNPAPGLASTWRSDSGYQRWSFTLRNNVRLSDGTILTPQIATASLRSVNPDWRLVASDDGITIEVSSACPQLPMQIALTRNSIVQRDSGRLLGSGPFTLSSWQPGKHLILKAREDYWKGRPFLDEIDVDLNRNLREQTISLDLGKVDLIDLAPGQSQRTTSEGRATVSSWTNQLLCLVFRNGNPSEDEQKLREALALSVDRKALASVILQGDGTPAGSILPNWQSGYAFLFAPSYDLRRARELRDEVHLVTAWSLGYNVTDPSSRLLAERIALNAQDAGLRLQTSMTPNPDIRLERILITSPDTHVALDDVARQLGLPMPKLTGASTEDAYQMEKALLESRRIIPLLHVPANHALAGNVHGWSSQWDGGLGLADVWLGTSRP